MMGWKNTSGLNEWRDEVCPWVTEENYLWVYNLWRLSSFLLLLTVFQQHSSNKQWFHKMHIFLWHVMPLSSTALSPCDYLILVCGTQESWGKCAEWCGCFSKSQAKPVASHLCWNGAVCRWPCWVATRWQRTVQTGWLSEAWIPGGG